MVFLSLKNTTPTATISIITRSLFPKESISYKGNESQETHLKLLKYKLASRE